MKIIILVFLLANNMFSQEINSSNFVLDTSKPYVYLKYDHIGPRKPVQPGEDNVGLWLRIVNNCRIPIIVVGHHALSGELGFYLDDEIIDQEPYVTMSDKNQNKKIIEKKEKNKPLGYSSEVAGIIRIQPGDDVLFSFPLNHVDDKWYLRIKFAFALNKSSMSDGPFTYLPYYKYNIPKIFRDY
jgi:hypothetical protein